MGEARMVRRLAWTAASFAGLSSMLLYAVILGECCHFVEATWTLMLHRNAVIL